MKLVNKLIVKKYEFVFNTLNNISESLQNDPSSYNFTNFIGSIDLDIFMYDSLCKDYELEEKYPYLPFEEENIIERIKLATKKVQEKIDYYKEHGPVCKEVSRETAISYLSPVILESDYVDAIVEGYRSKEEIKIDKALKHNKIRSAKIIPFRREQK